MSFCRQENEQFLGRALYCIGLKNAADASIYQPTAAAEIEQLDLDVPDCFAVRFPAKFRIALSWRQPAVRAISVTGYNCLHTAVKVKNQVYRIPLRLLTDLELTFGPKTAPNGAVITVAAKMTGRPGCISEARLRFTIRRLPVGILLSRIAMNVSVLMPVYSETDLLLESIKRLEASLGENFHQLLIVVSPKSTPECIELCNNLPRRDRRIQTLMQSDKPGIGWAYREAIPHITGSHALIISSDLETNPDDAGKLVDAADATGADIVCASRWLPDGGFKGYDPLKLVLNYGYNAIFRTLYWLPIHDITFGYRLMRTSLLTSIQWESARHEFCAEILLKPFRLGYTVAEVPTKWINRQAGESKHAFVRNFRFASTALSIRLRSPMSFVASVASEQRAAAG